MNRVKQRAKKSNSKTTIKSKHVVIHIADLLGLQPATPRKGFPDVLSMDLQLLVDAIEEDPRLLYDENYVITYKPRLVHQGQSFIRLVLDMLQLVGLESPTRDEDDYIERLRKARSWIEKFFDAAKSGMRKRFEFLGGRSKTLPSASVVKKDYIDILKTFTEFLKRNYSQYIVEKKIQGRVYLKFKESSPERLLDNIMKCFYLKHKEDGIPYVKNLSSTGKRKTNTAELIVKLLVAEKHNTTPTVIVKLLKIAKKAKKAIL